MAEFSFDKVKGFVEIKSVNHRYFDVDFYLPLGFVSVEDKIRKIIKKNIERGKVTISVKLTQRPLLLLTLNNQAIKQYLQYVKNIKNDFKLKNGFTISELIKLPGVIETKDSLFNIEEYWLILERALLSALRGLLHMRTREGKSLAVDFKKQLSHMSLQINKIQSRSRYLLIEKKKIFNPDEFISYQKNSDVNEEISRLNHYISEFKSCLTVGAAVGKKLDFIAQEMQRETNTIGSKLPDTVISNSVIALKSKIEKLREHSQNIE